MSNNVPLYEQDLVTYDTPNGFGVGEIIELDIPHPTEINQGLWMRLEWPELPQKIISRDQVVHVLCPRCHPDSLRLQKELAKNGGFTLACYLQFARGPVTSIRGGIDEIRSIRYCANCSYIKEVK